MNNWRKAATGQHIELGIAENNLLLLVMIAPHPPLPHHPPRRASTSLPPRAHTVPLLPSPVQSLRPQMAAAGLSAELFGHRLFPVGTLYDPFVCRALDSLIYGARSSGHAPARVSPPGRPSPPPQDLPCPPLRRCCCCPSPAHSPRHTVPAHAPPTPLSALPSPAHGRHVHEVALHAHRHAVGHHARAHAESKDSACGPPAFPQPDSPKREAALGLVLPLRGPAGVGSGQKSERRLAFTLSAHRLAPEGGAHQSIGTPLIGTSVPNLLTYAPHRTANARPRFRKTPRRMESTRDCDRARLQVRAGLRRRGQGDDASGLRAHERPHRRRRRRLPPPLDARAAAGAFAAADFAG